MKCNISVIRDNLENDRVGQIEALQLIVLFIYSLSRYSLTLQDDLESSVDHV